MHERKRGRLARTNAYLRGVLLTCALVVGGLLVLWLAVKSQLHDGIRREVERRFAERYREFRVSVQHARLYEGRGVVIHGLSVNRRQDDRPLAYVSEVFAACPVDAESLLSGRIPQTSHVRLSGLKLWAERQEDGSWDVERVWPLPEFSPTHSPVSIRDATIEVTDLRGGVRRSLNFRNVSLEIAPDVAAEPPPQAAALNTMLNTLWNTALNRAVNTAANNTPRQRAGRPAPLARFRGRADGEHVEGIEFQGWIDATRAAWSVNGTALGVQWSEPLQAAMPADVRQCLADSATIEGRLDLEFVAASAGDPADPPRFQVKGTLTSGRIHDRRLPFRLFDVAARFEVDHERLWVEQFVARNGGTTVALQLERRGWQTNAPLTVVGAVQQLDLDQRFLNVLPADWQDDWQKYHPAGTVSVEFRFEFDGRQWTPEMSVACHDVSFAYVNFPYRLERGRGVLTLNGNRLQIDLTAIAAGQQVVFRGEFRDPGGDSTGWLEFDCRQPIPLDEKLLAALIDSKARNVVRLLRPSGMFSAQGRFERTDPRQRGLQRQVRIELVNCGIHYKPFPYPVSMIRGRLLWDDHGWTFQNLTGRNGSAYIEGSGFWRPISEDGSELRLKLVAADVPLEDDLRDALQPAARAVWSQLRPRGTVDHVTVDIHHVTPGDSLRVEVTAQKWRKKPNDEGRCITVHPTWFPYRLDEVSGMVDYRDGRIQLSNISALHNQTQISLSGVCSTTPDGSWTLQLPNVVADRVQLDRDLLAALPKEMGKAAERLNFQGELSLRGALAFSGSSTASGPPTAAWDMVADVEDASLQCGVPLKHLHGEVRLAGTAGEGTFSSRGELNIDSVICRNIQLTGVRGPMWIDPSGILFGTEADPAAPGRIPQPLSARVVGGQVAADIRVGFEPDLPYRLQFRLERGDLAEFAQEAELKSQNIRGRANALLTLSGNRYGWSSWRGTGAIRLFEADIYEIPVMLALLKLLSIRQPDTTAFTSSEIDFRVQGEHIYLDRINFNGDAVSLKGSGEMDLERRINLKFYSLVGPGELNLPILRTVVRQASKQLLLIHVNGTLDQPQLTRDPLPLLKGTLEQIFPEAGGGDVLSNLPPLGLPVLTPARR